MSPDAHGRWFLGGGPPEPARTVLYCLPNAGGGGTQYLSWRRLMPDTLWVQPVQLPGRENRVLEDPRFEAEEVAEALAGHVDRPYVLYGHSMGGRLAWEVAVELIRREARLPERLYVAANPAPRENSPWAGRWAALSEEELFEEVVALGGVPPQVQEHPALGRRVARILAADVAWLAGRGSGGRDAPLPIPIVALAGEGDPLVRPAHMAGWADCTSEEFQLHMIAGGHLFHAEKAEAVTSSILQTVAATRGDLHGVR
ncbi:alpha/beta fold hydrolase [Kitasatospora sp. NPDC096140]|uniref:thioesterase II family protein n=1 Tax=Kitasatospora sp. NPDC096140 TaxID=3155425 RepID=UPI003333465C